VILIIETSGPFCSVAVCDTAGLVIAELSSDQFQKHAEEAPLLSVEVLKMAGITASQLQAVAVNKGPGSYTGLRIGTSLAKGICYAAKVPLIAVDGLKSLAMKAVAEGIYGDIYWAMIDARRDEVFAASYNAAGEQLSALQPMILTEDRLAFEQSGKPVFCGNSGEKIRRLMPEGFSALFYDNMPNASMLSAEASRCFLSGNFADLAYFEPDYGKAFMAGTTARFKV